MFLLLHHAEGRREAVGPLVVSCFPGLFCFIWQLKTKIFSALRAGLLCSQSPPPRAGDSCRDSNFELLLSDRFSFCTRTVSRSSFRNRRTPFSQCFAVAVFFEHRRTAKGRRPPRAHDRRHSIPRQLKAGTRKQLATRFQFCFKYSRYSFQPTLDN